MRKLKLFMMACALLGATQVWAQTDVTSTYITNADFSNMTEPGWNQYVSGSFKDIGNGLIGTYKVYSNGNAATVDETHLATEYCIGNECRWSGNYSSYNQTTSELPTGYYTLSYDVQNVNTSTTSATYNNLFYVQIGENKTTDSKTEWMKGNSSWTAHNIDFTINSASAVTISFGYGTGSNNLHVNNTPYLYVSHLKLYRMTFAEGYAAKKAEATEVYNSSDYANVTGTEKTNLYNLINPATAPSSDSQYLTAIDDINSAVDAFKAAKANYDNLEAAKAVVYDNNLPYASATKFAAIATAQTAVATSAEDAVAKKNAILAAYRKYVESNALAEGVDGAVDKTNLIADPNMDVTYDGTNHKFGAWQVFGQVDGTIQLLSGESFTDGDGKNNYKYADIWKSDNNAGIKQTVTLESGRYLLTVTARAATTAGAAFWVFAGDKTANISRIGNTGGDFDRGWNDAFLEFCIDQTQDLEIGVQSGNGKDLWWSATRFRLVKLPTAADAISETVTYAPEAKFANVTLTRTFSDNVWNTFVVPFNIDNATLKAQFGNEVQVAEVKAADLSNTSVKFTSMETPAITANKPVIIKGATQKASYTFNNVFIKAGEAKVQGTNAAFIGNYAGELTLDAGAIYIASNKLKSATGTQKIKGTRAYFTITSGDASRMVFTIDGQETTAIEGISTVAEKDGKMYNLNGQEVKNAQKGLYIKNGKKVVIK